MMGLFPRLENRSNGGETRAWTPVTGLDQSHSVDETSALGVPAVYACANVISNNIAALPVDVYRKSKDGVRVNLATPTFLSQPNQHMTPFEFWNRVVASLTLSGNAFIYVSRNDRGVVIEMQPVHPDRIEIKYDDNGRKYFLLDNTDRVETDQMLHIPGFIVAGASRGVSPIGAARLTMRMAHAAEEFGADFYDNGVHMTGVIEMPKDAKPEELDRLKAEFASKHRGKGAYAVGVLSNGASWKQITMSPADAQFIETRKFTGTQIAAMYQVPAYLIDPTVTSSWGSGIQEQNINFVSKTLVPWIVRIEQAISLYLLPAGQCMKFNVSALVRGSMTERYTAYHSGITDGWLTRNEVRLLEDLEPIAGLDEPLTMQNMAVDSLLAEKIKAEVASANEANTKLKEGN